MISYYSLGKNVNWVEAATGGFFADCNRFEVIELASRASEYEW